MIWMPQKTRIYHLTLAIAILINIGLPAEAQKKKRIRTVTKPNPVEVEVLKGHGGTIKRIDYKSKKIVAELKNHDGPVRAAMFSPDGGWAATGGDGQMVRVWDLGIPVKKNRNR